MAEPRRCLLHGRGLASIATLPALLPEMRLVRRWQAGGGVDAVLAWGLKPSARRAERWAQAHGLPLIRLEDGFLRSVGLGADAPPWSVVVDDLGIYYDASAPSRLERLIAAGTDAAGRQRAAALVAQWRDERVSKYNRARDRADALPEGAVLVVDQTAGDASIRGAQAGPADFEAMLQAALVEHPDRPIVLKVHPDVLAGRKAGHFGPQHAGGRVQLLADDVHPASLLERASAVYVVSSQMGFEALLWGKPVRCFGLPFYAGWGLTQDARPAPGRRHPVALEDLVHAALVAYPRYVDPESGAPCEVERLLGWMGWQRRMRQRFAPELLGLGFTPWKQRLARRFLAGSQLRFVAAGQPWPPVAPLVLWGSAPVPAEASGREVIRLEDGFIRSVGLGAEWRPPLSWVQDRRGLYYDASRPSDLEHLLQHGPFDEALRRRAAALRERIVREGVSKYNLSGRAWQRPAAARRVVLVIGQVESDASIRHGATGVCRNLDLLRAVRAERPGDWLVYKPHPDVVAALRAQGVGEDEAARHCDEVVAEAPIQALLAQVDEVHVMTSLTGFEALLRGVPVVAWGAPFYAGWGLTEDRQPVARRTARRTLDELVAAALILYPAYVGRDGAHFCSPEQALDEIARWAAEPVGWWRSLGLRLLRQLARGWSRWRFRAGPGAG